MDNETIFDISADPPTQEQIERKRKENKKIGKATMQNLIITAIVFFTWLIFVIIFAVNNTIFTSILFYAATYASGYIFISSISRKIERINITLDSLNAIFTNHYPDMLQWCKKYEKVRTYRDKVVAQKRPLTEGEYVAVGQWIKQKQNTYTSPLKVT